MSQQVNVYRELTFFKKDSTTSARMLMGDASNPIPYTAGTPLVELHTTCSNTTSTNAEPFFMKNIMTGTGGYGGRARFHAYTNATGRRNFMGLKSITEFGSSGRCAGLSTGFCAELVMPNADTGQGGAYAVLELEYVSGGTALTTQGSLSGNHVSFMYLKQSGDADGDFDDNGYFFEVWGLTAGTGHLYDTQASTATADFTLKIGVNGTTKYLLCADTAS